MSGSLFINLRRSLRKAFDTLPHQSLLRKLKSYKVKDINLAWFSDYLSNRNQVVCVDGTCSDPQPVLTGVPQGSILSPLLFILLMTFHVAFKFHKYWCMMMSLLSTSLVIPSLKFKWNCPWIWRIFLIGFKEKLFMNLKKKPLVFTLWHQTTTEDIRNCGLFTDSGRDSY